jgi:lysophospholipase L1-like esterase
VVDMYSAVNVRTDLEDALHPSDQGYRKIAAAWARAILKR